MRLHKSVQEIELMQIASNISADAHTRAMQKVHPEMMEYALEAELNYIFGQNGCVPAYNSIVGGGKNGCILHYVENNQPLKDGDLVLIDAAAEYECYASDITRTFPVNGHWLGMDVHDVGAYKDENGQWRNYEQGMVVTVEPGLYIAPDDETVDAKWRGIGIRIEDDVVATEQGPLVLTKNVVKSIEDIEALMAKSV
ncbi:unnamed protein product [Oppiella nova]|uniref:Peptidase M24 domain-containing protein n=1 Tax=Oppiella nova TaxID=334625 RepID=A0A7R9L923_9ACAR|nr:unnamed protein product [Oppiella nova]CAG2160137.1 unnamed protein product [Oppiella nova]